MPVMALSVLSCFPGATAPGHRSPALSKSPFARLSAAATLLDSVIGDPVLKRALSPCTDCEYIFWSGVNAALSCMAFSRSLAVSRCPASATSI